MRLAYAERASRITTLSKIRQDRATDSLRYREAERDPISTRMRKVRGALVRSNRSDGAVPGGKGGGRGGNWGVRGLPSSGGMVEVETLSVIWGMAARTTILSGVEGCVSEAHAKRMG